MLVLGMEYLCKQSYVIKDNVFSGKDLTLRRMVWYSDMAEGSIGLFCMPRVRQFRKLPRNQ